MKEIQRLGVLVGFVSLYLFTPLSSGETPIQESQLNGPFRHKNLEVYLISADPEAKPIVPANISILTLEEGLKSGDVVVTETGTVSTLKIENKSANYIYIHSGDILKGGKQDRTIPNGFTLAPHSGPIDVNAFCVEQGRWKKRGEETVTTFSSSTAILNSVPLRNAAQIGKSQQAVWSNIGRVQASATVNAGNVLFTDSPTSLQLSLDSPNYQKEITDCTSALNAQIPKQQLTESIGYVYALNGKFRSADQFVNPSLFQKMWSKLAAAMAAEAVIEYQKDKKSLALDKSKYIKAINEPPGKEHDVEKMPGGNTLTVWAGDSNYAFDNAGTIDGKSSLIHRNVAVKADYEKAGAENTSIASNDLQALGGAYALAINSGGMVRATGGGSRRNGRSILRASGNSSRVTVSGGSVLLIEQEPEKTNFLSGTIDVGGGATISTLDIGNRDIIETPLTVAPKYSITENFDGTIIMKPTGDHLIQVITAEGRIVPFSPEQSIRLRLIPKP